MTVQISAGGGGGGGGYVIVKQGLMKAAGGKNFSARPGFCPLGAGGMPTPFRVGMQSGFPHGHPAGMAMPPDPGG